MARRTDDSKIDDLAAQVAILRSLLEESSRINTKYARGYDEKDLQALDRIKQFKTEHPFSKNLGPEGFDRQAESIVFNRLQENLRFLRSAWEKQSSQRNSEAVESELRTLSEAIIGELKPLYLSNFVVYQKTEQVTSNSPFHGNSEKIDPQSSNRKGLKNSIRDAIEKAGQALDNDESVDYDMLEYNVRRDQSGPRNIHSPSPDYRLQISDRQSNFRSENQQQVRILQDRIADLEKALHEAKSQRLGDPDYGERSWNEPKSARRYEAEPDVIAFNTVRNCQQTQI